MSLALKQNESTFDISISIAWNKVGVTALKGSLLRNNFTPLLTLDNYWKTDSIKNNYCCSYCGAPPCYCKAEVFIKKNAPTKS